MNSRTLLTFASGSLLGASATFASPDYGPAVDRMITECTKWYTSGYGHQFAVVHSMEGYYLTGTSYLRRCDIQASCHYTVNGLTDYSGDAAPGELSQLVYEAYYAWHATCWNPYSLGTEHEGFVSNPAWFTESMYQASALLHRHFCDKFGIARDRNHIVGHNEKSSSAWCSYASANFGIDPYCNTHSDPGSYWDWSHFMTLIEGFRNPPYYFGSNAEGWTSGNSMSGIAWTGSGWPGIIYADQTGNDAWYYSPETSYTGGGECSINVGVFPQSGNTASHNMQMFFRTAAENYFSASKSSPIVSYTAQNNWVRINLDVNQVWPKYYNQTVTGLRLDVDNSNSATRWIINHVVPQASLRWRFDSSAEGWTSANSLSAITWASDSYWPGIIYADQTGNDPHFVSSGSLNRLGGINDVLHVRVYPQTGSTTNHDMQVFFATAGEGYFSEPKSMTNYYTTANNTWVDLYFNMGANGYWNSDWITQIRIDPDQSNHGNRWIIDSVQVEHLTSPAAIPGPSIGAQPQGQTVIAGNSVTFSVFPNGPAPFTYQWRRNGVDISGATSSNYTISNVQSAQAGAYTVVIVNPGGSVTSGAAILTVLVPPSITTQPVGQTVDQGSTVSFSAAATGTTPLAYQWRFNGTAIPGATLSSYTKSNVQLADAGNYSVVVTNIAGSVTSANALLTVRLRITTQPLSQLVSPGSTVNFTVVAAGTAPVTYQWRKNGVNLSNGGIFSGVTTPTLILTGVQNSDSGTYSVLVSDPNGSVLSADALLTISCLGNSIAIALNSSLTPKSVTNDSIRNYTFSGTGKISGTASLTKLGSSTLTLNTTNDYTGSTTVGGGKLLVNGAIGSGAVTVESTGTLGGTGAIGGNITVKSGGRLAPGVSDIGTLTIGGSRNVTLEGGSTTAVEVNRSGPGSDRVTGIGTLTQGGTLQVANTGAPLKIGDSFPLLSATTYSGQFDQISPANPDGDEDLAWDRLLLKTTGVLRVHHVPFATNRVLLRAKGVSLKIPLKTLFPNPDPLDGETVVLASQDGGKQGAGVSNTVTTLFYYPTNHNHDTLEYTVSDGRGGVRGRKIDIYVTNWVGSVTITNGDGLSQTVSFFGVPGYEYIIQRSPDLADWSDITTQVCAPNGRYQFTEKPPYSPAFYRACTP
ncbi:MAG TPA: immunoglobulin domain-containing protein [Verrucomicrobiota bacterium]|nr:immunoglobulin domain-containing protein [Verrucomicrobiota bacterium]